MHDSLLPEYAAAPGGLLWFEERHHLELEFLIFLTWTDNIVCITMRVHSSQNEDSLEASSRPRASTPSSEKVSVDCKSDFSLMTASAASAVPEGGLAGWLAGWVGFAPWSVEIFFATRQAETDPMEMAAEPAQGSLLPSRHF